MAASKSEYSFGAFESLFGRTLCLILRVDAAKTETLLDLCLSSRQAEYRKFFEFYKILNLVKQP